MFIHLECITCWMCMFPSEGSCHLENCEGVNAFCLIEHWFVCLDLSDNLDSFPDGQNPTCLRPRNRLESLTCKVLVTTNQTRLQTVLCQSQLAFFETLKHWNIGLISVSGHSLGNILLRHSQTKNPDKREQRMGRCPNLLKGKQKGSKAFVWFWFGKGIRFSEGCLIPENCAKIIRLVRVPSVTQGSHLKRSRWFCQLTNERQPGQWSLCWVTCSKLIQHEKNDVRNRIQRLVKNAWCCKRLGQFAAHIFATNIPTADGTRMFDCW